MKEIARTGGGRALVLDALRIAGATVGQVLTHDGVEFVPAAPSGGGGATTHTSGTLAARPAAPAAGDTYAVTSGPSTGARYTCFVAGTWERSMSITPGRSYERPDPVTAGGGARFLETDSMQLYLSSGQASPGWGVELASGIGPDKAGLTMGSVALLSRDFSAYGIDAVTLAVLYRWNGTISGGFGVNRIASLGVSNSDARGVNLDLFTNGANTDLTVSTANVRAVLVPSVNLLAGAIGLHAVSVAAVNVAGTHYWRFSYDGSAVADVAMGASYVPPLTADALGAWVRPDGEIPHNGEGVDFMLWNSTLLGPDLTALTTLPGTPTYALPESASTGLAAIRVQANRYDPGFPTQLPARGLPVRMTVTGVTKVAF